MVEFATIRRSLVALAFCSVAVAATSSPAAARAHHAASRHAHARHAAHFRRHYAQRHFRDLVRSSRWERGVAALRARGFAETQASLTSGGAAMAGSSLSLVMEARRYLGGNPTSRRSLWCARFMNMVLERTGHHGTDSDMASSFAHYGQRVSGPQVGAIAVMGRRGGGHVGIITGIDAHGNPVMISGNNGNRVREAPVSRGRIYAYVLPN
ncbi:MAG: TIGR02594 family protein [Bradyrhizobium sp.]|uniref:TIGR02594 family protein n=1 Tax=Bradyrhizobium sp. TaxID=376 RepID=UPI001E0EBD82|nr:TIGR02594 family protein [Bradyrhizobium sp.]MBV9566015.1 TIGR02594 family protein [Bradyrhizobium sp.]